MAPSVAQLSLSDDLAEIVNLDQLYLRAEDRREAMLKEYGFYITSGYDKEFFELYETNRYSLMPNFVTVDSMMHTYHLYFAYLMKKTEKNQLVGLAQEISERMLEKSEEQYEILKGTEWENAAAINVAFFAVGSSLIGSQPDVPSYVSDVVEGELELIEASEGIAPSPLLGIEEDYSQYIPRGYYDTDEALSRYFKTMMWYGRRNFTQAKEDQDRAALLMTMAMYDDTVLPQWEKIYTVTAFFAGESDDSGYYEYRPLLDAAYGENAAVEDLPGNTAAWNTFHQLTAELDPPQINSIPVYMSDSDEEKAEKILGYRFMGQRFTLDASIFTQLIYRNVKENSSGEYRMLPDALDVPAALGSDTALEILEEQGDTQFKNYPENMEKLRATVNEAEESTWSASLYAGWLNTLRPLLEVKGEGYPSFMQGEAWAKKNLLTFLGSYTELKHDTILYAKQVMAEMGGGPIPERDDRGYVEPEPEVYARLSGLVRATSEGLDHYALISQEDIENLAILASLADQLQVIAEKELREELPTDDEFDLIRTFGGQLEHFWQEVMKDEADKEYFSSDEFPSALVADIATDPNGYCLEVGTGNPSIIYVVFSVDGVPRVGSGTVYSFYQFAQPISERLTDTKWRQMMGIELTDEGTYDYDSKVPRPDWALDIWYDAREENR